jgi:hypothetical protein
MAKRLSPEEVTTILQSGDFNALLGAMEDHQLECKSSPYRLDEESEKFELAKDVSAMANVSGGVVLIGVRTRKDATLSADVVCDVSPFEESQTNIKQYLDVLREWCYPPLNTVDIRWWRSKGDSTKGIVAILVPSQTSPDAPHLVTKAPLPEAGQIKGTLFGHFERLRADVQPTSVEALRDRFKDGLRFRQLDERYQNIEAALTQLLKPSPPQSSAATELERRIRDAVTAVELEGRPRLALAAVPEEPPETSAMIALRDPGVVELLDDPPKLIANGFDLRSSCPSQVLRGDLRRSFNRGSKLLELWRDGTLIFVVRGNEWFLSWAPLSSPQATLSIHNLVLAEVVYLFAELACQVYQRNVPSAGRVLYRAELDATQELPYSLSPIAQSRLHGMPDQRTAPSSGSSWEVAFDQQSVTPGHIAFALLKEIYAWFGIEAAEIPYVDRSGPAPVVSAEMIRPGRG